LPSVLTWTALGTAAVSAVVACNSDGTLAGGNLVRDDGAAEAAMEASTDGAAEAAVESSTDVATDTSLPSDGSLADQDALPPPADGPLLDQNTPDHFCPGDA
jgi:hypothetical protein